MGVNSLPKTVTRQRRDCDLNPGPSAPESSTLTTEPPELRGRREKYRQFQQANRCPLSSQSGTFSFFLFLRKLVGSLAVSGTLLAKVGLAYRCRSMQSMQSAGRQWV